MLPQLPIVDCATCADLEWPAGHGDDAICAESDGAIGDCVNNLDYEAAEAACHGIGARLCTAEELGAGESTGTGCGHGKPPRRQAPRACAHVMPTPRAA